MKKIITTELVRAAIISWCKNEMFHLWLCVSLPISRCLDSSPSTEHVNSAAQTQPTLLTSVHRDVGTWWHSPPALCPQQRQIEAFIFAKDELAGTAFSSAAVFLANAWRTSTNEGFSLPQGGESLIQPFSCTATFFLCRL